MDRHHARQIAHEIAAFHSDAGRFGVLKYFRPLGCAENVGDTMLRRSLIASGVTRFLHSI
jgi:hypothetical protein